MNTYENLKIALETSRVEYEASNAEYDKLVTLLNEKHDKYAEFLTGIRSNRDELIKCLDDKELIRAKYAELILKTDSTYAERESCHIEFVRINIFIDALNAEYATFQSINKMSIENQELLNVIEAKQAEILKLDNVVKRQQIELLLCKIMST
jgi:hypothetical protein